MSALGKMRNRAGLPSLIARHPANQEAPGRALARSAWFQARSRATGRPMEVDIGSARMLAHIGVHPSTRVVYGSPPDWNEMHTWKRLLDPGHRFIDIGASVGVYTLWAASLGARVTAVEPDAPSVRLLRENLALNPGLDVEVVEAACADAPGRVSFTVGQWATGSLGEGVEVEVVTLDDLVGDDTVRGVKVDVEGFESVVLAGASRVLTERRVEAFQLEWNKRSVAAVGADREPVADLLRDHGYVLARSDHEGFLYPLSDVGFGADVFAVQRHIMGE